MSMTPEELAEMVDANELERASIIKLADVLYRSHHADIIVRAGGKNHRVEADWLRRMFFPGVTLEECFGPTLYDGRPLDDWFAEFWENYPRFRRTDKAACRNLFERIVNGKQKLGKVKITGTPAEIVDGARRMRAAQGDKYQYSINPARFLRNEGWTNEFEKPDNGRETAEQERDRGRSGIAAAVARRVGPGGSSSGDPGASRGDDRGAGTPLLTSDTDRGR